MKIYTSKYRNHWVSPYRIAEKIFFWREIDYDEPIVKKINIVLSPICTAWQSFLDFVHPRIQYVKIDYWDTWSMDHTLADVILPMLKQLRETKHGAPMTDDEDVPDNLKSINATPKVEKWDTDEFHFERWDWILDEMIWAFEQKTIDDDESKFFDHSENEPGSFPWNEKGEYVSKTKVDWDGLKAHQTRKANGYRLFGKYYEALWD
jgi:hypothetical protein